MDTVRGRFQSHLGFLIYLSAKSMLSIDTDDSLS